MSNTTPKIPSSKPFKGSSPKVLALKVKPNKDVSIIDPQEAQPIPKSPRIMPQKPRPILFCTLILFFK